MAKTRDFEFIINGMTCVACIDTVRTTSEKALEKAIRAKQPATEKQRLKLIENCAVDLPNDLDLELPENCPLTDKEVEETLTTSLGELGYGCARVEKDDPIKFRKHIIYGLIGLSIGLGLMIAMLLGIGVPLFLLPIAPYLPFILAAVCTGITLLLGYDTYVDAFTKLFLTKTINMNTLFTVSTLTALGVSIASIFTTTLPMLFDSALLIFGFRHIGLAIEESAKQKVYSGLKFRQRAAKKIRKLFDAKTGMACDIECNATDLAEGDIIYVLEKQVIPIDGIAIVDTDDAPAYINDIINTGSSVPHLVKHNESILAGMEVPIGGNKLKIKVSATENNSNLVKYDRNLTRGRTDETRKAPLQTTADTILKWFIPAVIVLALIAALVVGFVFASPLTIFAWPLAIKIGITILVSACPCTLGFIVPLCMRIGITLAATHGILFKSPESVEAATKLNALALDANGTVTTGDIEVAKFNLLKEDHDHTFNIIAALEEDSAHPFGIALRHYAQKSIKNKSALKPLTLRKVDNSQLRSGRQAIINGVTYTIGDCVAMKEIGISTKSFSHLYDDPDIEDVIFLAKDNIIISYLGLHTPIRPHAPEFIAGLKKRGIEPILISGANKKTLYKIAQKVGIPQDDDHIIAECISKEPDGDVIPPNHKIYHLREAQKKYGKVGMLGDGSNDARVIQDGLFDKSKPAHCDLGIAFRSSTGSLITQQNASVVVGGDSFKSLTKLFTIASMTITNIKANLLMSLGQNVLTAVLIGVLIGFGIMLPPPVGVALMVVGACVILLSVFIFKRLADAKMKRIDNDNEKKDSLELSSTGTINKGLDATPVPGINLGKKLEPSVRGSGNVLVMNANSINKASYNNESYAERLSSYSSLRY